MPLYAYVCPNCDVVVEERRPMDLADFPPVECPICHTLCTREMALVNIIRSGVRRRDEDVADAPPGADDLWHPPSCPCCGGLRAR
jgi:putative FmdB family regulatory protein